MANDPMLTVDQARELARKRAENLKGFFVHLGVYLIVIGGLFFIDIASGSDWWFFYPAIAWGVAVAIHGMVVGVERVFDDGWTERKAREWRQAPGPPRAPEPAKHDAARQDVIGQSAVLIDLMRRSAREIPKPDVRQQVLGLCASADLVLSAIEENPEEEMLARDFHDRYLTPASSIIAGYSRLANRDIASARATLEKVETHDLNQLAARIDEIYDRLHRGSLIDLEVAREMFGLDVADWEAATHGQLEPSSPGNHDPAGPTRR